MKFTFESPIDKFDISHYYKVHYNRPIIYFGFFGASIFFGAKFPNHLYITFIAILGLIIFISVHDARIRWKRWNIKCIPLSLKLKDDSLLIEKDEVGENIVYSDIVYIKIYFKEMRGDSTLSFFFHYKTGDNNLIVIKTKDSIIEEQIRLSSEMELLRLKVLVRELRKLRISAITSGFKV